MKLNLGCGNDYMGDGWTNVDIIKDFLADVYLDLRQPLPYPENYIERIKAKDILEHFSKYDAEKVFKSWVFVLQKDGFIEVTVPDIEVITSDFKGETLLNLIFGEQKFSGIDTGNFGLHKWGYTKDSLRKFFETNGLEIMTIHNVDGTNIYAKGKKI